VLLPARYINVPRPGPFSALTTKIFQKRKATRSVRSETRSVRLRQMERGIFSLFADKTGFCNRLRSFVDSLLGVYCTIFPFPSPAIFRPLPTRFSSPSLSFACPSQKLSLPCPSHGHAWSATCTASSLIQQIYSFQFSILPEFRFVPSKQILMQHLTKWCELDRNALVDLTVFLRK